MKRFSEQFKKQADTVSLTGSERDALRARVSAYMEYHPLPAAAVKPARTVTARSGEPFIMFAMPSRFVRGMSAFVVLFFVVGTPLMAERAVPGDLLYPMKVRVNEEVMSSLSSSGYEKVAWETKRLERRIAEARLLAKAGRLTPEAEAAVIAAVGEHQDKTAAEIATLRETDADAAALAQLTFVSVLDVQSEALKMDTTGSTTEGMSTVALALALDEAQSVVAQTTTSDVSYDRIVAQLEQETTRGRELLASIKDSATAQEYTDLERRVGDVERKVAAGTTLYTTDVAAGLESLKQTWRDMQVIITFMTDIDVRSALAIDTMVPVVLTPEEERVLAQNAYLEAEADLLKIAATMPSVTDVGIRDKVALTIPQIEALLLTATTSFDTDIKVAKQAAEEAREYTRSIMRLAYFNAPGMTGDEVMMMTAVADIGTTSSSTGTSTETDVIDMMSSEPAGQ